MYIYDIRQGLIEQNTDRITDCLLAPSFDPNTSEVTMLSNTQIYINHKVPQTGFIQHSGRWSHFLWASQSQLQYQPPQEPNSTKQSNSWNNIEQPTCSSSYYKINVRHANQILKIYSEWSSTFTIETTARTIAPIEISQYQKLIRVLSLQTKPNAAR